MDVPMCNLSKPQYFSPVIWVLGERMENKTSERENRLGHLNTFMCGNCSQGNKSSFKITIASQSHNIHPIVNH